MPEVSSPGQLIRAWAAARGAPGDPARPPAAAETPDAAAQLPQPEALEVTDAFDKSAELFITRWNMSIFCF